MSVHRRITLELAAKVSAGELPGNDNEDLELVKWLELQMEWGCDEKGVRENSISIIQALDPISKWAFGDAQQVREWVLPSWRIYEMHEVSNWGTKGPCYPTGTWKILLYDLERSAIDKPYCVVGKGRTVGAAFINAIMRAAAGCGEVLIFNGGSSDNENFANYPITIGEGSTTGDASEWKPRDALISLLRRIDAGEVNITALIICALDRDDDNKIYDTYRAATPDKATALGLLDITKHRVLSE